MSMGIRRGAARPGVQVGGKSAHAPLLVPVPLGISPGGNVLEQPSDYMRLPDCDTRPGDGGLLDSRPVSYLVQPPARSGAGGPVRNSEAGRGEPETLESVLAAVGGA